MNNTSAKVIADSINESEDRVITLELEYPRIIHAEFLTHRVFSRNGASSRAIPVITMLKNIWNNMFVPWYWGANQPGMQASKQLSKPRIFIANALWKTGACINLLGSYFLSSIGVHKQLANRNTEYASYIKTIVTSTDFDNFINLRLHPDAQPEICDLAFKIKDALANSKPVLLKEGEWHLPYVPNWKEYPNILEELKKVSVSCCAQVSYRTNDTSIDKAIRITDKLISGDVKHSSPFEHVCTPGKGKGNLKGWIQYREEIEKCN
jgi:hypothetical protein